MPLRSFVLGKARLARPACDALHARSHRVMAERVVAAAGDRPLVIVSSAPKKTEWARDLGLDLIPDPGDSTPWPTPDASGSEVLAWPASS